MLKRFSLLLFVIYLFQGTSWAQESSLDSLLDKRVYQKNIKVYRSILKTGPNNDVTLKLADALRLLKKYEESSAEYGKVIDNPGLNPIHYKNYSEVLCQLGQTQECEMWRLRYKEYAKRSDKMVDAVLQIDTSRFFFNRVPFNSPGTDFGPTFYKKGLLYVSSYTTDSKTTVHQGTGESFYKFYYSEKRQNGEYGVPQQVFKGLNTATYEGPLSLSADNKTVYFNRNNLSQLKAKTRDKSILLQFVKGTVGNDEITEITDFEYNDSKFSCTQPSLSLDGQELYFASNVDSAMGGTDLFVCQKINGKWSEPQSLGPLVNTVDDEMYPFITREGKLFFSSSCPASIGGLDVFMTERINGQWIKPIHLDAPFNTIFDDFSYIENNELGEGYLSSNRAESIGMDDIFLFNNVYKNKEEEALYHSKLISIINKDKFPNHRGNKIKGKLQSVSTDKAVSGNMVQLLDKNKKVVKQCYLTPDGFFSFSNLKADNYLVVYEKGKKNVRTELTMTANQAAKVDIKEMAKYRIGYVLKDSLNNKRNKLVVGKLVALGKGSNEEMVSLLLVDSSGTIVRRIEVAENSYFIFRDLPSDNYSVFTEDNNPNYKTTIFYQNPDKTTPIFRTDLLQFHYKHLTTDSLRENNIILHGRVKLDTPDGNIVLLLDGNDNVIDKTTTNSEGYFAFRELDGENMHIIVVNDHPLLDFGHETVYQKDDSVYHVTKREIYKTLPYDDSLLVGKTIVTGRLSLEGKPLEDRLMLLMDGNGHVVRTTKTNKDGYFAFRHLNADDFYIIANEKEPKYLLERHINWEDPLMEVQKPDFKRKKSEGFFTLGGSVYNKSKQLPIVDQLMLLLDDNGNVIRQVKTGKDGEFHFTNLQPDHYLMAFETYQPETKADFKLTQDGHLHEEERKVPVEEPKPNAAAASQKQDIQGFSVFFDYNSAMVSKKGSVELIEFAQQIGKSTISGVELHGYTDMSGSDTFNLALAQKRIQKCHTLLQTNNPQLIITTVAEGKTRKFLDKNGQYAPALNRRVELRIVK